MTGSALDRPAARIAALLVALGAAALAVYVHRNELFPAVPAGPSPQAAAKDAFQACFEPRVAEIDRMVAEGTYRPEQATLFKNRAEAMCRAEAAKGSGAAPGAPPPRRGAP